MNTPRQSDTPSITLLNSVHKRKCKKKAGGPGAPEKSGKQQIRNNADSILSSARTVPLTGCFGESGELPCLLSKRSLDGRGRPQRAMRIQVGDKRRKVNFRSYHVTWAAENGELPERLTYSHRCHHPTCCEPSHGVWETNAANHDRNQCKGCSHIFLPERRCIVLCPHTPSCLVGVNINDWKDDRVFHLD